MIEDPTIIAHIQMRVDHVWRAFYAELATETIWAGDAAYYMPDLFYGRDMTRLFQTLQPILADPTHAPAFQTMLLECARLARFSWEEYGYSLPYYGGDSVEKFFGYYLYQQVINTEELRYGLDALNDVYNLESAIQDATLDHRPQAGEVTALDLLRRYPFEAIARQLARYFREHVIKTEVFA